MTFSFLFAALLAMQSLNAVPLADRPEYVVAATDAVSKRDVKALQSSFPKIGVVGDDRSDSIDAQAALDMLAGCSEGKVTRLLETTYVIDYLCPTRHAAAKGCDSGDLFVMATDRTSERSFVIAHRRKLTLECPPPAPPVPPSAQVLSNKTPFSDPKDYYRVAKHSIESAIAGNDREVSSLIWPDSKLKFELDRPSLSRTLNLDASSIRSLLIGCKRDGQIEVDNTGTTMSFVCANKQLAGRYRVTFEYYGQKVMIAFISSQDDKPGDASVKADNNG